jgi:acyl-coenzyme A synthetase/AMP-(fatty) acid ligase
MQYPNMLECAVVGVPHRVLGEEVGCVARVRPEALEQMGEKKLTEDIVKFMRTKMAVFKIPTHW